MLPCYLSTRFTLVGLFGIARILRRLFQLPTLTSWESMAASHRQLPVAVKLAAINDHLVCHLCGGYIMEATAVVECLHACELLERRSNVIAMFIEVIFVQFYILRVS